jgi:hypothetical protein
METPIGSISNVVVAVALCAMFVIVLACVHGAIKRMSFFGDAAGWVVTVCVALLSIVGLVRFFGSPEPVALPGGEPRETGGLMDVVLLPYVALALTILLVLLLLAIGRVLHGREPWHPPELARNRRTVAGPHVEEVRNHRKETKPAGSSKKRHIAAQKNGEMIKKTEGTRSDS